MKKVKVLPGAVEFFTLADSLSFSVFYISSRSNVQLQETILKNGNFQIVMQNIFFKKKKPAPNKKEGMKF